jgi:hypothetical protein
MGGEIMKYIGIADPSFADFPEIKAYFPCALSVKECRAEDGREFRVAQIISGVGKKACLYPLGDSFARKTCEVIFGK